jgi:tetraprenyl-beta-curcumene synthase
VASEIGSGDPLLSGHIPSARDTDTVRRSCSHTWTLLAAAARQLHWALPNVSREVHAWRHRAQTIPDAPLRHDALDCIKSKRDHTEGAALFSILPRHRDSGLLRLLVVYQTIWDFLDDVSEHGADRGTKNGHQLHVALAEALDIGARISDYYKHHPWKDDGGYLVALVEDAQVRCATLPSYSRVAPFLLPGVARCSIQSINHDPDPSSRNSALKGWAAKEFPTERTLSWFELTAAASAFTPHVLLALAAECPCDNADLSRIYATYFPWVSLAIAMLDSYVDQMDDATNGAHSYIAHYPDSESVSRRLCEIIRRAIGDARKQGYRHAVIVACMVAMYLSKDGARTPETQAITSQLAKDDTLITWLLPLARAWRAIHVNSSSVPKG